MKRYILTIGSVRSILTKKGAESIGVIDWAKARKEKYGSLMSSLVSSEGEQSTILKRRWEHRDNDDEVHGIR
jgi:hypothetical protein